MDDPEGFGNLKNEISLGILTVCHGVRILAPVFANLFDDFGLLPAAPAPKFFTLSTWPA